MAIDPAQIDLTAEQRQRLALLVEQTGRGWTELVDQHLDAAPVALQTTASGPTPQNGNTGQFSLFDVLSERGILGCFEGPTDLSTNPKHMEGFGESRDRQNSD